MIVLKYAITLVLFSIYTTANCQIITVSESYKGDKRVVEIDKAQIIEINSTLEIQVSKEKLLLAIKSQFPQLNETVELESQLIRLQQALRNQSAVISILENQMPSAEEQKTFFEIMDGFLTEVQSDPILSSRYEELSAEFFTNEAFVRGNSLESYIISNLNNDISTIKAELKTIETNQYNVSVVAYKKDVSGGDRVHIQNYDTYSNRDFFTVERWVTSLSAEDQQQLEALAEIAKENNEREFQLFQTLKAKLIDEFGSLSCVIAFKNNSIDLIQNMELNDVIPVEIKVKISALQSAIHQFETLYQILKTDLRQWNIGVLLQIKNRALSVVDSLKNIDTNISDFKTLLSQTDLAADFSPLLNEFNTCYIEVQTNIKKLENGISLLFGLQTNYIANKSIGDEVLSFSLDNLPDKGFINLKDTGKRQNGDELLIEAILRIPSKVENTPEQIFTLEQREFTIQLIGARSEVAVGLIFANPFNKDDLNLQSNRDFFYAPSASILLKFGSSKSYFYNEFIDFGVGLNFASPDFNTDGSPEFGVGLITTAFKDIISIGINYNTTIDNFYWFFGINLPFNLPGLPVNTIKN
ncbi:hypothetical protein [Winogradskyella bathintestinalis]|uniref:Uncharacterized protein n=1 Tax=Winogradskyella bathintestinalis TaxID=3035208 RepID=A0ABT7ZX16_9FLAO|nr:hypothetical protein [Winogradskyella bathintestinalis]MDN3493546.1 hypothetical protein [Winogradskyella bathintestinalis]